MTFFFDLFPIWGRRIKFSFSGLVNTSSLCTPFSFMYFIITSLYLSFVLRMIYLWDITKQHL